MATPARNNAASTPKTNLNGTPTRMIPSPRPGTSRPFAAKSPAIKTPAAGAGHSHTVSTSSQPTSTPLNIPPVADDLLAFNSPAAALMASLGSQGLTPLGGGQDGLGISSSLHTGQGPDAPGTRTSESEKLSRLQLVSEVLQSRAAGRGVTREGVERLALLNGFSLYWDDDIFSMAGNCVDLEIVFDHLSRDTVRDVNLKINASGEEEQQIDASDILKRDLSTQTNPAIPWKSIDDFAANLATLKQLDSLSNTINCFGAIGGLDQTFRSIWEEEKKRMTWRDGLQQLCHGTVGRPRMNANGKLGLAVEYWTEKHGFRANSEADLDKSDKVPIWTARISCETGFPSISKAQQWLLLDPAHEDQENGDDFNEYRPPWQDPSAVGHKDDSDAMTDKVEAILEPSNVRFVCYLDPLVLLPLNAVGGLNSQGQLIQIDQSKVVSYQQSLLKDKHPDLQLEDGLVPRWIKQVTMFDSEGKSTQVQQSYAIYSAATQWCYPVDKLSFTHPRQLVEALPVLRQYALLWSLLSKLVTREQQSTKSELAALKSPAVKKRSNKRLIEINNSGKGSTVNARPVDVSLDLISQPSKAVLEMIIPLPHEPFFAKVSIEIGLNGDLQVVKVYGVNENLLQKMNKVLVLSEDLGILATWVLEKSGKSKI